jgi:rare lipoprotein A
MSFVSRRFGPVFLVLVLLGAIACGGKKAPTTLPEPYSDKGTASWYGKKFHGRRTANGERFDMYALTAAHRTLPFGSIVQVTDLENGGSVKVRINDRGPFTGGRIIDLSYAAAKKLRMVDRGVAQVKVTLIRHK